MKSILKTTALGIATVLMFVAIGAMFIYSNYDPEMARIEKISDHQDKLRAEGIRQMQQEWLEQQKVAE